MKLNIGSGQNPQEGYLNIDKMAGPGVDLQFDLEVYPWEHFKESSIEEVRACHVLEHLSAFPRVMQEIYRVLQPGGRLSIKVPHPRSDGFTGDPTHKTAINANVLSLFSQRLNKEWAAKGWPNTPLGVYLDVDFEIVSMECTYQPPWDILVGERAEAEAHLWNVIDELRFEMIAIKKDVL